MNRYLNHVDQPYKKVWRARKDGTCPVDTYSSLCKTNICTRMTLVRRWSIQGPQKWGVWRSIYPSLHNNRKFFYYCQRRRVRFFKNFILFLHKICIHLLISHNLRILAWSLNLLPKNCTDISTDKISRNIRTIFIAIYRIYSDAWTRLSVICNRT